MSNAEILAELPKLTSDERDVVFHKLCELQEQELLHGAAPSQSERAILDQALAEYQKDGKVGTPWRESLQRIRRPSQ